ncbi:hypothetical protein B0T10DRAFT_469788, partial [Thelonectria olida]
MTLLAAHPPCASLCSWINSTRYVHAPPPLLVVDRSVRSKCSSSVYSSCLDLGSDSLLSSTIALGILLRLEVPYLFPEPLNASQADEKTLGASDYNCSRPVHQWMDCSSSYTPGLLRFCSPPLRCVRLLSTAHSAHKHSQSLSSLDHLNRQNQFPRTNFLFFFLLLFFRPPSSQQAHVLRIRNPLAPLLSPQVALSSLRVSRVSTQRPKQSKAKQSKAKETRVIPTWVLAP